MSDSTRVGWIMLVGIALIGILLAQHLKAEKNQSPHPAGSTSPSMAAPR